MNHVKVARFAVGDVVITVKDVTCYRKGSAKRRPDGTAKIGWKWKIVSVHRHPVSGEVWYEAIDYHPTNPNYTGLYTAELWDRDVNRKVAEQNPQQTPQKESSGVVASDASSGSP